MDQKPINYVFEETPLASTVEDQPYVQPEIMKKYNITTEDLKCTKPKTKKKRNFVNENEKNEAYWKKRQKNNLAAKRSRESKRARDNKIVDTANLLEKENSFLKEQIFRVRSQVLDVREQLQRLSQIYGTPPFLGDF